MATEAVVLAAEVMAMEGKAGVVMVAAAPVVAMAAVATEAERAVVVSAMEPSLAGKDECSRAGGWGWRWVCRATWEACAIFLGIVVCRIQVG